MRRKALFVGVNNYRDGRINNLSCAVNDAVATCEEFARNGFETALLKDEEVTSITLRDRIRDFCSGLKAGDIFVFYFSGHGHEVADNHYLLCPGTSSEILDINGGGDALPIAVVRRMSENCCEAGVHRLFILDCCRNNVRAGEKSVYETRESRGLELVCMDEDNGIIPPWILRSCQAGQRSYEDEEVKHGFFTLALGKALEDETIRNFPDFFEKLKQYMNGYIHPSQQRITLSEYSGGSFPLFEGWQNAPEPASVPQVTPGKNPPEDTPPAPEVERSRFLLLKEKLCKAYALEVVPRDFPVRMRPLTDQISRLVAKLRSAPANAHTLQELEILEKQLEEIRLFNEKRDKCQELSKRAALEVCGLKDAGVTIPEKCTLLGSAARKAMAEFDWEPALSLLEESCRMLLEEKEKIDPDFLELVKEINAAKGQGVVFSEDNKLITACRKKDIVSCVIPHSVTTVGAGAFRGCSRLQELFIPEGVTSIAESAFEGCSALSEVRIPKSVVRMGKWAFAGCRNLKKVRIAGEIENFNSPEGKTIFEGCPQLQVQHEAHAKERPGLLDWLTFLCQNQEKKGSAVPAPLPMPEKTVTKPVTLPPAGRSPLFSISPFVYWFFFVLLVCFGAGFLIARFFCRDFV